jgi:mono/diheme cytochrome c family protein
VRRRDIIRLLILAGLAAVLLAALAAFGFIKSGLYNVGAAKPHTKLTFWVTNETMIRSVKRHARSVAPPARFTAAQAVRGFCEYEAHCVACHGAPAVAREQWVGGLEPQPPYLLDATHKFTSAELFWIAKNGIKMTGMPSWKDEMSDRQIWDVVAFLEASRRRLPSDAYLKWRASKRCAAPPSRMPR